MCGSSFQSRPPISMTPSASGYAPTPPWENFITSLSSIDTKPAGPMRLACRNRRRVMASSSSPYPKKVQASSNSRGPEQRGIAQPEIVDQRLHVGVVVGPFLLSAPGDERAVAAGGIHLGLRGLVGPEQAEADQKHVQQARVVGVLDVLEHQLPVRGDQLARVAEHRERTAVENAVVQREHRRAEVFRQGLQAGSE